MHIRLFLLVLLLLFTTGCGDPTRPKDLPRCYPVQITIIQDDKPLQGAMVALISDDPSFKWNCVGTTDENGVVDLHTLGKFRGVPAGNYSVTVSKTISISPKTRKPVEAPNQATSSKGPALTGGVSISPDTLPIPFNTVDKPLASHLTTSLKLEVLKKKNAVQFDVGQALVP